MKIIQPFLNSAFLIAHNAFSVSAGHRLAQSNTFTPDQPNSTPADPGAALEQDLFNPPPPPAPNSTPANPGDALYQDLFGTPNPNPSTGGTPAPGTGGTPNPSTGGTPAGSNSTNVGINNPLQADSIIGVVNNILDFLIKIGAPIVSIMVLWGGFQILTAGGEPEKAHVGKRTILYALIGYGIILISRGVGSILENLING